MEKELVVRMAEAEQELVTAVNDILRRHSLPCFLMEPIMAKIHRQLIDGKAAELEQAKLNYRKSLGSCTEGGSDGDHLPI